MSGATFSENTNPTEGLQPYDLDRRVKNLAPETARVRRSRKHRTIAGLRALTHMHKGFNMDETVTQMIETLNKSVAEIADAGPEGRGELLTKTFAEFSAALAPVLEFQSTALAKSAEPERLFKGLGTVGRVADLAGMMADHIEDIKGGGEDDDQDDASPDVVDMLDHAQAMVELALRAAVNEHVDVADEGDTPESVEKGVNLVVVPDADAPNDPDLGVLVKTLLPAELAQFATYPADLGKMAISHAATLMLHAGVPEAHLAKAFGVEGELSKAFPPDQADPGADPSADPNADPSQDDSQDDPLDVLGRLLAACMIQLDHVQQMVSGGDPGQGAPADPAPDADPNAPDPEAPPADPEDKKKPPMSKVDDSEEEDALRKAADLVSEMQRANDELKDKLAKALAAPVAPKGAIRAVTLEKAADGVTGGEGEMEALAKAIDSAKTPEDRAFLLTKAAQKFPGIKLDALSK